jgi:diacylglycerol kinase family enzyme
VERELGIAGALETVVTARPGHATTLAAEVSAAGAERVYVFSGDGGFNEVVNGIEGDVPVGFIPGGGTSVLSRALGLPRDPVQAARVLATEARERTITLGRIEGSLHGEPTVDRRFLFAAGLGLDAELVRAVDRRGRSKGRRPGDATFALLLGRLLVARRGRFEPALTVTGRGRAAFALVANCDPYTYAGPVPLHVAPGAGFELGLDLAAPVELRASRLPGIALALARPKRAEKHWILRAHDVDELLVECDLPLPLQADGEDLGDVTAAAFRAERDALRVLVAR